MTNSQLYETIFKRKSVRKFDMAPLDTAVITEVKNYAAGLKSLDERIKHEFIFLTSGDVKGLFPIKAPHYVCFYSEKKEGYLMNAGFLMQQMDLYFSASKMGSCWLGTAKPSKNLPERKDDMEFVIMIAFGNPKESLHRANIGEFKRKNMAEITDLTGMDELLEPVRLAPSSNNLQPWYLNGASDEITVNRKNLNVIIAPIYNKLNQIDIGIALLHLWLSLDHQGRTSAFEPKKAEAPKGYDYMVTVKTESD